MEDAKAQVGADEWNEHYFKFDRDSENLLLSQPKIQFKIEDVEEGHRYKWTAHAFKTDRATGTAVSVALVSGKYTGTVPATVTVRFNDPAALQAGQDGIARPEGWQMERLTEWGTYAFNITLEELDENDESLEWLHTMRSYNIFIPALMPLPPRIWMEANVKGTR